MADVRVVQKFELDRVLLDWMLTPAGNLDDTYQLETAVIVSLCTDRRAEEDDTLPDSRDENRRGWWGDIDTDTIWGGGPIGSRLWLLARAKITGAASAEGATVTRAEDYIAEALQWLIDLKVASRIDVEAVRSGQTAISALVTIYRGPKPAVSLRFEQFWDVYAG